VSEREILVEYLLQIQSQFNERFHWSNREKSWYQRSHWSNI